MERKRRGLALLLGLLAVLAVILVAARERGPAAPAPSASNPAGAARPPALASPARTAGAAHARDAAAVDVRLEALAGPRPEPIDGGRSLFRFQQKAPPPPPPQSAPRSGAGAPGGTAALPAPTEPAAPPPPPPIALKFIGIVEAAKGGPKLAVLTDGRAVYHGREGDIVEGRYRVVRIGVESVEMEYVDGRGRQTIRLSGS